MEAISSTGPDEDEGIRSSHEIRFTQMAGIPAVTLFLDRWEFEGVSIDGGVQRVVIDGSMITGPDVIKVAEIMPRLIVMAYSAVAPDMPAPLVGGLVSAGRDSGIAGEVARAAVVYRQAVEDGRRPLQAVMKDLNLAKATASRRIRAAKDQGLITEGE